MKNIFSLKFALALSIFVNLFLVATVVGAMFMVGRHFHDIKEQMPRDMSWRMKSHHDPEHDKEIFVLVEGIATLGEADMRQAMKLRAEALSVAQKDPFDKAKVLALSTQARNFEHAAREKVEAAMIEKLADKPRELRVAVMQKMMRPGFRRGFMRHIQVEQRTLKFKDKDGGDVETHFVMSEHGPE